MLIGIFSDCHCGYKYGEERWKELMGDSESESGKESERGSQGNKKNSKD